MADLELRILNVFTDGDQPFTGNPLGVFPDAGSLTDEQMQALGRQLNLSETTFVTEPLQDGRARVRIFTPVIEMAFAGHPTLGTAAVIGDAAGMDEVVLSEPAGDIPVRRVDDGWELGAPAAGEAQQVPYSPDEVAAAIGVPVAALASTPVIVSTGTAGLMVALRSAEAVRACRPDAARLEAVARTDAGEPSCYVFGNDAMDPEADEDVTARMFYVQGGAVLEDPATGSQCANLGAWLAYRGFRGRTWTVRQGEATGRPSVLRLTVADDGAVRVAGSVRQVGTGTFTL